MKEVCFDGRGQRSGKCYPDVDDGWTDYNEIAYD